MKTLFLLVSTLFSFAAFAASDSDSNISFAAKESFFYRIELKYRMSDINEKINTKKARDAAWVIYLNESAAEKICTEHLSLYESTYSEREAISKKLKQEKLKNKVNEKTKSDLRYKNQLLDEIADQWTDCFLNHQVSLD